ncbi:resistance protein candidate RGC20, partial [Tanacetum coccineum]
CDSLEYVFTCSMVGSILQLQDLDISYCDSMKEIVKGEEECDANAIVNAIVEFPCLKSLKLERLHSLEGFCLGNEAFEYLESLEGFCLGKEAFEFPSLDTLQIDRCEEMRVFTKGDVSTPKLYAISSRWLGTKFYVHNKLNSFMNTSPSKRD